MGSGRAFACSGRARDGHERLLQRLQVRVLREGLGDELERRGLRRDGGFLVARRDDAPRNDRPSAAATGRTKRRPRPRKRARRFEETSRSHLTCERTHGRGRAGRTPRGDLPADAVTRAGTPHPREAGSDAQDGGRGREGRADGGTREHEERGRRLDAKGGHQRPAPWRGRRARAPRPRPPGSRRSRSGRRRSRRRAARSTRARRRASTPSAPARSRREPAARPRGPGRRARRRASGACVPSLLMEARRGAAVKEADVK